MTRPSTNRTDAPGPAHARRADRRERGVQDAAVSGRKLAHRLRARVGRAKQPRDESAIHFTNLQPSRHGGKQRVRRPILANPASETAKTAATVIPIRSKPECGIVRQASDKSAARATPLVEKSFGPGRRSRPVASAAAIRVARTGQRPLLSATREDIQ
ncbi:MAG: hypothetical protein LLF91_11340 [Xanthomonadaceae bacterium]|nr:hypothetical protein [Xanthomonadaceae bacterium]